MAAHRKRSETRRPARGRLSSRRRGNALAEFVLILPVLLFVMVTIFVMGRGLARKQRTIVASRYATQASLLGVGRVVEDLDAGQQFPGAHPYLGLLHPEAFGERYFSYLPADWSRLEQRFGGDDSDALREAIDRLDVDDDVRATEVVSSFWTNDGPGYDILYRERGDGFSGHWSPHGMRVWVAFRPAGLEQTLGGPFAGKYMQDYGGGRPRFVWDAPWEVRRWGYVPGQTWEFDRPNVWRQLFWTPTLRLNELKEDLVEFDRIVHEFTYDPYDAASFERWFYDSWPRERS